MKSSCFGDAWFLYDSSNVMYSRCIQQARWLESGTCTSSTGGITYLYLEMPPVRCQLSQKIMLRSRFNQINKRIIIILSSSTSCVVFSNWDIISGDRCFCQLFLDVMFQCSQHHTWNFIHLYCAGDETEILEITKPAQIKPKQPAWQDDSGDKWEASL